MLQTFGHPVATCCNIFGVVGSSLKMVKCFMQHLWMLHDVVPIWPGSCNNDLPQGMHTSSGCNTQHVAASCNRVAKHMQHVVPNNIAL